MSGQLTFELPEARTVDARSYSQRENDSAVRSGYVRYHPKECRRRIMTTLSTDRWTGFTELAPVVGMHPRFVTRMLNLLIGWGRVRRIEYYFVAGLLNDRTVKPQMKNYSGFEYAYRLTCKEPQ